jgi:hypothetical protein
MTPQQASMTYRAIACSPRGSRLRCGQAARGFNALIVQLRRQAPVATAVSSSAVLGYLVSRSPSKYPSCEILPGTSPVAQSCAFGSEGVRLRHVRRPLGSARDLPVIGSHAC